MGIRVSNVRRWWLAAALIVWALALVTAYGVLLRYQSTSGAAGDPPPQWPADAPLARAKSGKTVLLLAHPRCPCTRATLRELEIVVANRPDWDRVRVLFFRPRDAGEPWIQSDIVQQAKSMTGVEVAWDDDGRIAALFGARTSGHILVYDERGALEFTGGVTAFRGHEGVNAGRDTLIALAHGEAAPRSRTPVFGCPLFTPQDAAKAPKGEAPR
ncbi:MAG: hypothetical protein RIC55_12030 [Pirellulaceae bacterium]